MAQALPHSDSSRQIRTAVRDAVASGDMVQVEQLVASDSRTVRHLMGLTHVLESDVRNVACDGIGIAARYYPRLMESVIRRLISSMSDESGANGLTAPFVLQAIARQAPELLLDVVPKLVKLAADDNLHDGLADAICIVVHKLPGKVGRIMGDRLQKRVDEGRCCDDDDDDGRR